MDSWKFYLIYNKNYTYAGVSPDPIKRLRKHNGEICGGAKYTTSKGSGWKHMCIVSGFNTKIESMQFEWAIKHVAPRKAGGIKNRIKKLYILLNKERWTSKAPLSNIVPLHIKWLINPYDYLNDCDMDCPEYITQEYI
jgi:predicted GIY-YIG superfamily endonuclease